MAKKTIWASSVNDQPIVPDSLMSGTSRSFLNQERWSEHFQDLSDYCNTGSKMMDSSAQQSGEQLNTPNITVQDEFDFGLRSSSGERFDVFDESDPWEAPPSINTTQQTELWGTVNDWLSTSNKKGINDQETIDIIDVDDIDPDETPFDIVTNHRPEPIKLDNDYVLSQSSFDFKQSPPQSVKELNREQSYIDLVSLLKQEQTFDVAKRQDQDLLQHSLPGTDHIRINNNNSIAINMNNNVIISSNNNNSNGNRFPMKTPTKQEQNNLLSSSSSIVLPKPFKLIKTDEFVNDSNANSDFKNGRDPTYRSLKNLSSIFKSEEPLISESIKQSSSCITNNNNNNINNESSMSMMANSDSVNVAAIVIRPKTAIVTSSSATSNRSVEAKYVNSFIKNNSSDQQQVNYNSTYGMDDTSVEYIIPDIKTEPIDITDMEVESINEHNQNKNTDAGSSIPVTTGIRKLFKIPGNNGKDGITNKKTGLKLDIDSASRLVAAVGTPTLTPTTTSSIVCETNVSLSTPDVLRPLLTGTSGEFNLLSYISEDGAGEELHSANVFNTNSGKNSPVVEVKKSRSIGKPMKRHRKSKAVIVEKCESAMYEPPSSLLVVKEEKVFSDNDETYDESREYDSESPSSSKRSVRTTSKRRRIVKKSEDMEFDMGNISDIAEEDDEKHDKTFQLTPNRRKRTISNTSRTSTSSSTYTGSKRKHSRETDSSDLESVTSGVDRYRELRDRNNEASRRSRLNRKSREMEMKQQAGELERENRRLKKKADEMEALVKRLREGLLQLVLKNRSLADTL